MNSSAPVPLSPAHQLLADALAQIHGKVRVAIERSGVHFYLPCPSCLQEGDEDEVCKRHLAVNADKVIAGRDRATMCMKCDTVFSATDLLRMKPLEERGYERVPGEVVSEQPAMVGDLYEPDGNGNMLPKGPGETIALTALPEDHPAIWYIRSRQFNPAALYQQFGAEYCTKERPDVKHRHIGHRFKLSPQGRIVFYMFQHGVRVGWQARQIEASDDHRHYLWNGYRSDWVAFRQRESVDHEWQPRESWGKFDPPKYLFASGMRRNACLAGFDAAVEFNRVNNVDKPFCVLVEGVMDAARFGAPAIASLGKYLSENQAALVKGAFQRVVLVPDNDGPGETLIETAKRWLEPKCKVTVARLPSELKDAAEMDERSAKAFLCEALVRAFNLPPPGTPIEQIVASLHSGNRP
jgi:hypothetical protein